MSIDNTKRRDHLLEVVLHLNKLIRGSLLPILALFIGLVGESHKYTPLLKLSLYSFMPFIIIYSGLYWLNKVYVLEEEYIYYTTGVFLKRDDKIPYDKVKSVDINRDFLRRILGLSKVSIELIGSKGINFVVSEFDAEKVRLEVLNKSSLNNELSEGLDVVDYEKTPDKSLIKRKFNLLEYICMPLGDIKILIGSFVIASVVMQMYLRFTKNNHNETGVLNEFTAKDFDIGSFLFVLSVLLVFLSIVSYIFSFAYIFLTYSRFTITKGEGNIVIKYGLVSNKEHLVPTKEMRSLRIEEPFIYRLFGYVKLSVDNIGEGKKNIIISPIMKKKDIESFLQNYLPVFDNLDVKERPINKSLKTFLLLSTIKYSLFCLILIYFNDNFLLLILLLPLSSYNGYLHWRYSGIGVNDSYVSIRKVSFFKRIKIISRNIYVQEIETKQNPFMKESGTLHYHFKFYYQEKKESFLCKHIRKEYREKIIKETLSKK